MIPKSQLQGAMLSNGSDVVLHGMITYTIKRTCPRHILAMILPLFGGLLYIPTTLLLLYQKKVVYS